MRAFVKCEDDDFGVSWIVHHHGSSIEEHVPNGFGLIFTILSLSVSFVVSPAFSSLSHTHTIHILITFSLPISFVGRFHSVLSR